MRLRLFTLRKPSKVNRPVGSPLMAKAERAAVGPGTTYTGSPAAGQAATYRHAYCQNPVCVPSRCSFLTGQYPHVHGHRTMRYMLHGEESSLFSELKAAGYHVWMNARNDFLPGQDPDAFARHADEVFL